MRALCVHHLALLTAVLAGALVFVAPASAKAKKATSSPFAAEVKELHDIKVLLELADRDYKGHRAEAVKQLTEAIHALHPGHKHKGKGVKGGKEPQRLSDAQLKESIKTLNDVLAQLTAAGGAPATKAAVHVTNAIKDLEVALTIK